MEYGVYLELLAEMQTFTGLRRRQADTSNDDSGRNIPKIGCDLLVVSKCAYSNKELAYHI